VVRLPPFYFGQTQDRGNGKNLCRSHPKLSASLVPKVFRVQAQAPEFSAKPYLSGKSQRKLRSLSFDARAVKALALIRVV